MRAGLLRHVVELQAATITVDAHGDGVREWTTFATEPAAIEPLSGREYFAASQVGSEVAARIRIRYREGITSEMRVKHGSVLYGIEAVIDVDGRGRELHLMVKTGSGHGD